MRVNVQLVDAKSGAHLWAERFDKPVADFFDMQDEIAARLANQLNTELVLAEARRSQRQPHPDLLDLFLQGVAWLHKGPTFENLSQARSYLERALAIDPGSATVLVQIAFVDFLVATYFFPDDRAARLEAAEAASVKAISLAPEYPYAHLCLGSVFGATGRVEQGIAECERALAINRNVAVAHATVGVLKVYIGRAEETEADVREALRLSPRDPTAFYWLMFVGVAKFRLGRYEEALNWLQRSIEANRNNPLTHILHAATLALLGRLREAQAAAQSVLALNPQFTIARFRAAFSQRSPGNLDTLERIIESLRTAGLPEG
jgi:tetratricopeptide (TPR) repeat protein